MYPIYNAAGANTQSNLRCLTDAAAGGWRTLLPHEVKLATQIHIGDGIHYADAVNGKDKDAVRLPLAQGFMYLVRAFTPACTISLQDNFLMDENT